MEGVLIRELKTCEYPLMRDFLHMSIFVPEGCEALPFSIVDEPEVALYIKGFGEKKDDYALCAYIEGELAGMCWVRIMGGYGSIDDESPEFAIAVKPEYRAKGIGENLMRAMLNMLKTKGYKRASLSVQKENIAAKLYFKLGFEVYEDREREYILVYTF